MNKLLTLLAGAAMILPAMAAPRTIQGQPYAQTRADFKYQDPDPITPGNLNFDDIKVWVGEGENKCAFVIQFSPTDARYAYVIGYKWDGDAYGVDLVKDVVKAYPRLYGAWTDGGTYGTTINGFGWDPAMDGNFTVTLANGTIETPDGQGVFSASAASYDGAHATNDGDWWEGGWYDGYWSYWIMEQGDTSMGYSPVGASSRKLTNGCVDGWMFAANMQTSDWKTWVAAVSADQTDPVLVTEVDPDTPTGIDGIDADNDREAVYYNMQGIKIDNPTHGLYIRVCNGKSTKVIL